MCVNKEFIYLLTCFNITMQGFLQILNGTFMKNSEWFPQVELGKGMFGNCSQGVDINTGHQFCIKTVSCHNISEYVKLSTFVMYQRSD